MVEDSIWWVVYLGRMPQINHIFSVDVIKGLFFFDKFSEKRKNRLYAGISV